VLVRQVTAGLIVSFVVKVSKHSVEQFRGYELLSSSTARMGELATVAPFFQMAMLYVSLWLLDHETFTLTLNVRVVPVYVSRFEPSVKSDSNPDKAVPPPTL